MTDAVLVLLTEADFEPLARLAEAIWRAHYGPLIGLAQVEYMLKGRYTPEKLRAYLDASDRWLRLLKLDGETIGYCSYALTTTPGEMKLEQLYLLEAFKGRGLGGLMMRHVEAEARAHGCGTLMLTVNKGNTDSIAVYKKSGFTIREEAVFDIGNGFVMDDYVMEKQL
ncbi:MAG TPA: GNAT family N-acetyltransferase [Holophagaceae bacterium]|jgi:ribosomal protein S18 acetylase RimI-like enzyme|nr:GNAT family N-acetyltransferase [Holophagaceae bacterium]